MENEGKNILKEPAALYATPNSGYYQMAERAISKTYIKEVLRISNIPLTEFIELIPISIDTYKRKSIFNPAVTEKVLEIEEVYRTGLKAFGESFYTWMNSENIMLDGHKPKALLSNSFGIRQLLDLIGRIEYGVLA